MIDLLLSIICSTSVLMTFKVLKMYDIEIFQVIVINYALAATLGVFLNSGSGVLSGSDLLQAAWFPLSILVGVFFIGMFLVIGISTQKAGLVATTISTRMSVVIPILFSIVYYQETLNLLKISGVLLALTALACSMFKNQDQNLQKRYVYLPVILFMGMGLLHTIIKFAQQEYIPGSHSAAFSGACFFFAFISGLVISLARRVSLNRFIRKEVLLAGIILGTCNFGTIFFLIRALNSKVFDSSVIFGINSTGIVGCSVLAALIFFKEKLSALNWTGVVLSVCAILLFMRT